MGKYLEQVDYTGKRDIKQGLKKLGDKKRSLVYNRDIEKV